jgi:hypothetical protein
MPWTTIAKPGTPLIVYFSNFLKEQAVSGPWHNKTLGPAIIRPRLQPKVLIMMKTAIITAA